MQIQHFLWPTSYNHFLISNCLFLDTLHDPSDLKFGEFTSELKKPPKTTDTNQDPGRLLDGVRFNHMNNGTRGMFEEASI